MDGGKEFLFIGKKSVTVTKLDTGNTTVTTDEGDILITPAGTEVLINGGLTVGSTSAAGDNNLIVEGDITANGNILGDDATVVSNIASLAVDTIVGDGAALVVGLGNDTVAINSSDWDISATGAASGLGTIASDGDITVTKASGAAIITSKGASGEDASVVVDADNGADNADTWTIMSRAADNDLVVINHTTTNLRLNTAGDVTITGDLDVDGNDVTSAGDLTITPGGTDVLVDGGLNVGGTTQPGDNNLRVEGTLAQVGAATFTADITANGNIVGDTATDITQIDDATFQDLTVTNAPSFVGRYALLSKDATTQYATEHGTCTNLQAVTFTTAYAAAPQVFLTHQALATNYSYVTSITVNGFTANGDDGVSMAWFAIGQK